MIRATTLTLVCTVGEGADLSGADNVWVTLKQGSVQVTKTLAEGQVDRQGNTLTLGLTQEETLAFTPAAPVQIQVNWMAENERSATEIVQIPVEKNLISEVLAI